MKSGHYLFVSIFIATLALNIVIPFISTQNETLDDSTSNNLLRSLGIYQKDNRVYQTVPKLTSMKTSLKSIESMESELVQRPNNFTNGIMSKIQQGGGITEHFVDIKADVDTTHDIGNHGTFSELQTTDSIYDNLTEVDSITRGNTAQGHGGTDSFTISHTLGYPSGNNRLVIATVGFEHNDPTITIDSIRYKGNLMTEIEEFSVTVFVSGFNYTNTVAIYYILDDNLPSSIGSYDVTIACSSDPIRDIWLGVVGYIHIKQEGPDDSDSSSSSTSVNMQNNIITTENGSLVIQAAVVGNTGIFSPQFSTSRVLSDADTTSSSAVINEKLVQSNGSVNISCIHSNMNRGAWVAASFAPDSDNLNYQMDLEVQFTGVYDSPTVTEELKIKTGIFGGTENLTVNYWDGDSWELITPALTASAWNNFTVFLTSPTFTIKFSGSTSSDDNTQDLWEIDSVLITVEEPEEISGDDHGFVWLKEPDEVDLGGTFKNWVLNQDLSDDSVPILATGVILAWVNNNTYTNSAVARGSQDTNDYMNQGLINCEFEQETWRMQVVKLKDHKFIDTWRETINERLYVMGYTVGADPKFSRVAKDLGSISADSSWHRMNVTNIDDSTSGVILFTQSTSNLDATILVRAVGSTDSMTSMEWEEYNCGMMFVKLDENDQFEYYVSDGRLAKFYLIAEVKETVDWLNANRTDISSSELGSTLRDLDDYIIVSSNASGVILQHEATGYLDYKNSARENGQNWFFPMYDVGGDQWLMGGSGIDDNNSIELTVEHLNQDAYIHAITLLFDETSPVFSNFGVDDLGTGEGIFWTNIIEASNMKSVTIKINETYYFMSHNGSFWIYQLSIDNFNDHFEFQIWNATDSLGNSQTTPTLPKNHTFNFDLVAPTVLEMDFTAIHDMFNTNVSDDWGMIDTVIVNITSYEQKFAIMRYTPSGYINDTIDLAEGIFEYEIIVNDTRGNIFISPESVDYSYGFRPIATNLTLTKDNVTLYSYQRLTLTYDYFDAEGDDELGTEIRWYKNSLLFPLRNDKLTVPDGYLFKGDVWSVTVKPKDGTKFGMLKYSVSIIVRNTPPEMSNYAIFPSEPTNITNLIINYDYYDEDNDNLTFEIDWYKNDANQTSLHNRLMVEAGNTTKGQEWYFKIRAYDGENYSDWYSSNVTTIINSAPTIINTPTFNQTNDLTQFDNLTIMYEYSDVDNDPEDNVTHELFVEWYKWTNTSGPEYQPLKNNETELLSIEIEEGEVWWYIIRVFDGSVYSGEYESLHVSIAFENTAPEVEYPIIYAYSYENLTIDDLYAYYTYSDYDGHDEVGSIIVWYLNRSSVVYVAHNYTLTHENYDAILTILSSETLKGDLWWFSVLPKDGIEYGEEWTNSSKILIRNSLPGVTDLTITSNAYNLTDLVADWIFCDNDTTAGDYESNWNITWYIQGVGRQYHLDGTRIVNAGNTTKGQVWYYFALVFDGEEWSIPINSSEIGVRVKIKNSLPQVSEITITQFPYTITDLEADWKLIDSDNDPDLRSPEYLNISWYKNGIIQLHLYDMLLVDAENTMRGEYWYFILRVFDGENWSASTYTSEPVLILNSRIRITGISINNNDSIIYTNDDLFASISFFDPDGDIYYSQLMIKWYINNVYYDNFDNQMIIPYTVIQKGQEWYFNISIADNVGEWSEYKLSQVITISNSKPSIVNVEFFFEHGIEVVSPFDMDRNFLLEDEILTIDYSFIDTDNDQSNSIVLWYLDNGTEWIIINQYTNKTTLSINETVVGQVWRFEIQPHDGTEFGLTYFSSNITIYSRPTIIDVGFNGQKTKEGDFIVWVSASDLMNEINEVKFDVTIIDLNFSRSWRITSTNGTSNIYELSELDLLSILGPGISYLDLAGKNISLEITVISLIEDYDRLYSIKSRTSFSFSIQDYAPPRIMRAWFVKDNSTSITFHAEIEEYGEGISEITLYYYFAPITTGIGAASLQTELSAVMNYQNKSGDLYFYTITINFLHNQTSYEVNFRISTEDSDGNINKFAYTNQESTDKQLEYVSPGIPVWVLYLAAGVIFVVLLGSIVYIKYIRKPELVGLDKDIVIENLSQVSEEEINHAISDHTLGIVISIFDQWHGPIPFFVEPIILRDNFETLVVLSDRSFSASRFIENFIEENSSNFEFELAPGVSASTLTFGFSLNRPDMRGGAENITLNILINKTYKSLVNQFIDQFSDIVHEIHILMDEKPSEKEIVAEKVVKLRRVISSIILAYESIYGSVDTLDADE